MRHVAFALLAGMLVFAPRLDSQAPAPSVARPRARDLGIEPGVLPPGPLNAITDVAGVAVGHVTLFEGDSVRTGVTAVLPHAGNLFRDKVAGGVFVGNAFGKLAGSTQVEELGTIETPIVLTNTLSVGTAIEGVVAYTLSQAGNADVRSVNAVVGETNDGELNDIRGMHVSREQVMAAIRGAAGGRVAEGSVGAGTGTRCFGWKGGIGTSSRVVAGQDGGYTLGVLVQTNFGGLLTIAGARVGEELGHNPFAPRRGSATVPPPPVAGPGGLSRSGGGSGGGTPDVDGSCMIVVATDAPIDARDLRRLAARAVFALARTGSSYSNGSGDYAIAFTTSPAMRTRAGERGPRAQGALTPEAMSPLFEAVLEATEEAVYNSLFQATRVESRYGTAEPIPIDLVREALKRHGLGTSPPYSSGARRGKRASTSSVRGPFSSQTANFER